MNYLIDGLRTIVWTIAIFFYYFQVPFLEYAGLITVGLALFMMLDIKRIFKIFDNPKVGLLYLSVFVFCLLNLLYSISNGTEPANAFRFLLILMLLPLCPFFQSPRINKYLYDIFAALTISKAIMLIVIAIMLISAGTYTEMRKWAMAGQYGDIYFANIYGNIPRVQLKGNALLVVAFMISYYKNKFNFYNIIVLVGIFCAGNFAFFLGLAIFFCWMYAKSLHYDNITFKKVFTGILLLVTMSSFCLYAFSEQEAKSGVYGSNGMRKIQYEILTDTNELYGSGLGRVVYGAPQMGRAIDDQYYELQTLYIYYQVGIICLFAFYILMFYAMGISCNRDGFIIFIIYLLYSFFNPYCFDTTQMITMMIISSQFSRKRVRSNNSNLSDSFIEV